MYGVWTVQIMLLLFLTLEKTSNHGMFRWQSHECHVLDLDIQKSNPARKRWNYATPLIFPTKIFVEKTKFRNLQDVISDKAQRCDSSGHHFQYQLGPILAKVFLTQTREFSEKRIRVCICFLNEAKRIGHKYSNFVFVSVFGHTVLALGHTICRTHMLKC